MSDQTVWAGLSPLARGTRNRNVIQTKPNRFIPAGAGNSFLSPVSARWWPVYPRWCGELEHIYDATERNIGLSPLARGTQRWYLQKTKPRGLSRLARGTQILTPQLRARSRFIPACAGNSATTTSCCASPAVYPRRRGELKLAIRLGYASRGLSPLARGTPGSGDPDRFDMRFIPAGAGNSNVLLQRQQIVTVYPRRRGELCGSIGRYRRKYGLSPLARGTPVRPPEFPSNPRFIPAGAGNSLADFMFHESHAVYPRWRGELCK